MLARESRITKAHEFEEIREKGKSLQSASFTFGFLDRNDNNPARFGFIVSNKISKKAVIRNHIKRTLRESVRSLGMIDKTGFDCVFVVKPIITKKHHDELVEEINAVLRKCGVLK